MYSVTEFVFSFATGMYLLKVTLIFCKLILFVNKYCSVNFVSLMRWFSSSSPHSHYPGFPFGVVVTRVSFFILILITLVNSVLFPALRCCLRSAVCKE